ncbi:MAG: type I-E CRISPR-associated protein Cas5/CasD [Bacillota bacterium]|nr:type I-E CRISPR-associated protein Cas5/CasD [Bacillota bacterium]
MAELLFLRLEGILQSWGERARWDTRDTASVPTKSGVIGLLTCAMGIPREDVRLLQLEKVLRMGVRVDFPGLWIEDYHTVKGYIQNAEGNVKKEEETKITPRRYLQDASFLVVMQGDKNIIRQCGEALRRPVWQMFLGRKCCVPTSPILEGLNSKFESIEEAMVFWPISEKAAMLWESSGDYKKESTYLSGELERSGTNEHEGLKLLKAHERRDVALGNPARHYLTREVWTFSVPLPKDCGKSQVNC